MYTFMQLALDLHNSHSRINLSLDGIIIRKLMHNVKHFITHCGMGICLGKFS